MSLGVLNNISALYTLNSLNTTQASLSKTLQQLSSGSRINSGADDAAGLAVADGLTANSTALAQSTRNASDAIGLLQTADGALSQVTSLLTRAVTLATQASNSTLTTSQVSSANQEYQNILTQIADIGTSTNFNGNTIFNGSTKTFVVSDGTTAGTISYSDIVGVLSQSSIGTSDTTKTALALSTPTASAAGTASTTKVSLATATDTVSGTLSVAVGTGTAVSLQVAAGTSLSDLATQINANADFTAAGVTASYDTTTKALTLSGPATAASTLDTTGTALTEDAPVAAGQVGAGVDFTTATLKTLTSASAQTILTTLGTAISGVALQRGSIGADINQLSSAQQVAATEQTNLTAAQNNISATDYGQAASDLSKYQVLSQTGISALAQANSVQQEVLKLLQ